MSAILGLFEAQMLGLTAAVTIRRPTSAHLYLSRLLIVLAGMLTSFAIGYAGVYDRMVQRPRLDPILAVLLLGSMTGYAVAGYRVLSQHRRWLLTRRAHLAAANRVRLALVAFAGIVVARSAYLVVDTVIAPLSYVDMVDFYVVLAITPASRAGGMCIQRSASRNVCRKPG